MKVVANDIINAGIRVGPNIVTNRLHSQDTPGRTAEQQRMAELESLKHTAPDDRYGFAAVLEGYR